MIVLPFSAIILVALDIYVIVLILNSSAEAGAKLLWIVLVMVLPLIGPLLYLFLGRGAPTL